MNYRSIYFYNLRIHSAAFKPLPNHTKSIIAKPFLKWAGGKTQLIPAIEKYLPENIKTLQDLTYVEPFIGSGAVFFWFIQNFEVKEAIINDVNADLINVYHSIKESPKELIYLLEDIQNQYYALLNDEVKKNYFLEKRKLFNSKSEADIINAALFIFLNRTCFNGLYRVNKKNEFNVPFGRYARPKICNETNILAISKLLQKVTILNGDYESTLNFASHNAFFYFDPPYKPISKTASFNAYATGDFNDIEQKRLALFTENLTLRNKFWLLSNSDPKNINADDDFFDQLYDKPENTIFRVKAKRMINSNATKRGEINEILIMNY
ncbi:DNA adenine methylase [Pedobacter aquatilis]|uniref:DNA adenine methylase n=1 Tax=Pedobacter aquatilis TaxID=351343 RepID=UPI0025B28B08|nr:DNA adenine methylase [Pedobacter aquatilis]MDN3585929.1 DNA adenine methylase [Pedobacter aquatilis]